MDSDKNIFIVAVGLPARGKSYLFKKLEKYFAFLCYNVNLFNLGDYRRKLSKADFKSNYFTAENEDSKIEREKFAQFAMNDAISFIEEKKHKVVVLYDGTNTTVERRNWIRDKLSTVNSYIVWVEMVSNDNDIISNYIKTAKIKTSDYKDTNNEEEAYKDFCFRVEEYKKVYVPCCVEELRDKNKEFLVQVRDFGQEVLKLSYESDIDIGLWVLDIFLSKFYRKMIRFNDLLVSNNEVKDDTERYVLLYSPKCQQLELTDYSHITLEPHHMVVFKDNIDLIVKAGLINNICAILYIHPNIKKYTDEFC